ncbi:MAG: hypothetical protein ACREEJ_25735 [Ensifer adhaerens]
MRSIMHHGGMRAARNPATVALALDTNPDPVTIQPPGLWPGSVDDDR